MSATILELPANLPQVLTESLGEVPLARWAVEATVVEGVRGGLLSTGEAGSSFDSDTSRPRRSLRRRGAGHLLRRGVSKGPGGPSRDCRPLESVVIVVAHSGVLGHLVKIMRDDLVQRLHERVLVPLAVLRDFTASETPAAIRNSVCAALYGPTSSHSLARALPPRSRLSFGGERVARFARFGKAFNPRSD